ncbi:MAG TPA: S8 family serine peptidase [Polyangia bacterium]|nr:S8 family serine peptidase [Polyangia bacterium]
MKTVGRYLATLSLLLGCDSGGPATGRAEAGAVADAPGATGTEAGPVGPTPDAGAVAVEAGPLRNVVMVVDDGFDPSVAELSGKVVASHTIVCDQASDNADGGTEAGADPLAEGANPDFATAKRDLIAALHEPDRSCQLHEGMQPYDQALLASVDGYRDRWNAALRADTDLTQAFTATEYAAIVSALQSAPQDARVHGTSVAGLLAYQNPDLRLVLVQYPMLSSSEVAAQVQCISQATIDQAMALLADAEVRAAYVGRPRADLDRGLDDAISRNNVGSLNLSLGVLSTKAVEDAMVAQGCAAVDLGPWQARLSELDRAQEAAQSAPSALAVQSAGNEGVTIDSPADSADCRLGDPARMLVGAYGVDGVLASFSNRGLCVDVLAPGKAILAPLPGNWLLPQDGTSFSAPLVARLASMEAPLPFAPSQTRTWLVSLRDSESKIPAARFPADVVYDPKKAATTSPSALTFSPASVAIEPPGSQRTDAVKLHRMLWILDRLAGR